jgi:muramoyltetrapeptide carboxypeptidase
MISESRAGVFTHLREGDTVRFISPASPPDREAVTTGKRLLEGWGLKVDFGAHVFDRLGHYLAGRDEHRLADLNDAMRDPGVRAIFCTTGGKGSYRIAHGLDLDAVRRDPKPLIGFSDITTLHLVRWKACRAIGLYGPMMAWDQQWYGREGAESLRAALMDRKSTTITARPDEPTWGVRREGAATGVLMGGTLGAIAKAVGWACPSFADAILMIEAQGAQLGEIDSSLTQLMQSGVLDGVRGVAVGRFFRCGTQSSSMVQRLWGRPPRSQWTFVDVLTDRLRELTVPVLGGLPIGHGPRPLTVRLGALATIDSGSNTLTLHAE